MYSFTPHHPHHFPSYLKSNCTIAKLEIEQVFWCTGDNKTQGNKVEPADTYLKPIFIHSRKERLLHICFSSHLNAVFCYFLFKFLLQSQGIAPNLTLKLFFDWNPVFDKKHTKFPLLSCVTGEKKKKLGGKNECQAVLKEFLSCVQDGDMIQIQQQPYSTQLILLLNKSNNSTQFNPEHEEAHEKHLS